MLMSACCANKGNTKSKSANGNEVKQLIVDNDYKFTKDELNYTIESAVIVDSILTITVNSVYKDFDLYFNGMYAKSMPPIATLFFVNTSEDDSFDEKKTLTFKFDIGKAKYNKGDKTIVKIHEFPDKLILNH